MVYVAVLLTILMTVAIVGWVRAQVARWRSALAAVAAELELGFDPGTLFKKAKAHGTVEGFPIVVDSYTVSTGKSSQTYTRITISGAGKIPGELLLEKEGLGSSIKKAFIGEDIQLGDPAFDTTVVLRGDRHDARVRFDEHARITSIKAVSAGVRLKKGEVSLVKGGLVSDSAKLLQMTLQVIGLATALDMSDEPPQARLLRMLKTDSEPELRRRSLQELLNRFDGTAEASEAAEMAIEDEAPNVRLAAARTLRRFEPIAEVLRDRAQPGDFRRYAAEIIGTGFSGREDVVACLEAVLAQGPDPVVAEVLRATGRIAHEPRAELLEPLCQTGDSESRLEVARMLGRLIGRFAEPSLIRMLDDEDKEVVLEVMRSLAKVGSRIAVQPLLRYTKGVFTDSSMKDAARQAIKAIQSRQGNIATGRLSLSEETELGNLSITNGTGALGLAEEEGVQPNSHADVTEESEEVG